VAPLNEPDLLALALAYGQAFAAAGWRGPCNIQGKRDPELGLQVIETNGRFSGGTSARRLLGFDEVALGLRQWLGDGVLSADPLQTVADGRVDKLLGDQLVHGADIQALSEHGLWRRC
jgi:carbamoyl-phosphate synthase large subunit